MGQRVSLAIYIMLVRLSNPKPKVCNYALSHLPSDIVEFSHFERQSPFLVFIQISYLYGNLPLDDPLFPSPSFRLASDLRLQISLVVASNSKAKSFSFCHEYSFYFLRSMT